MECFKLIKGTAKRNTKKNFDALKSKADSGDMEAQYLCGLYWENEATEPSKREAAKYYKLSADQNYMPAIYGYANCVRYIDDYNGKNLLLSALYYRLIMGQHKHAGKAYKKCLVEVAEKIKQISDQEWQNTQDVVDYLEDLEVTSQVKRSIIVETVEGLLKETEGHPHKHEELKEVLFDVGTKLKELFVVKDGKAQLRKLTTKNAFDKYQETKALRIEESVLDEPEEVFLDDYGIKEPLLSSRHSSRRKKPNPVSLERKKHRIQSSGLQHDIPETEYLSESKDDPGSLRVSNRRQRTRQQAFDTPFPDEIGVDSDDSGVQELSFSSRCPSNRRKPYIASFQKRSSEIQSNDPHNAFDAEYLSSSEDDFRSPRESRERQITRQQAIPAPLLEEISLDSDDSLLDIDDGCPQRDDIEEQKISKPPLQMQEASELSGRHSGFVSSESRPKNTSYLSEFDTERDESIFDGSGRGYFHYDEKEVTKLCKMINRTNNSIKRAVSHIDKQSSIVERKNSNLNILLLYAEREYYELDRSYVATGNTSAGYRAREGLSAFEARTNDLYRRADLEESEQFFDKIQDFFKLTKEKDFLNKVKTELSEFQLKELTSIFTKMENDGIKDIDLCGGTKIKLGTLLKKLRAIIPQKKNMEREIIDKIVQGDSAALVRGGGEILLETFSGKNEKQGKSVPVTRLVEDLGMEIPDDLVLRGDEEQTREEMTVLIENMMKALEDIDPGETITPEEKLLVVKGLHRKDPVTKRKRLLYILPKRTRDLRRKVSKLNKLESVVKRKFSAKRLINEEIIALDRVIKSLTDLERAEQLV
ncbi:MAG: hypothetical protein LBG48_01640 [Rickettsiales bacterium]|jgi:hypothetical protein|nr:hypothetical protein [Rickettsiales bacterium]